MAKEFLIDAINALVDLALEPGERLALTGSAQEVTHTSPTKRVVITCELDNGSPVYVSGSAATVDSGDEVVMGQSWAANIDIVAHPIYVKGTAGEYVRIARFV